MANSLSWEKIFSDYKILEHDFSKSPFPLSASQIKKSCQKFTKTNQKEVRILCKQDTREDRPRIFQENGLFLLPVKMEKEMILIKKLRFCVIYIIKQLFPLFFCTMLI